jgi:tripartite-type tricarboxylate transporter receptor subunit TctC
MLQRARGAGPELGGRLGRRAALGWAGLALAGRSAAAQTVGRPARLIVGFPPGGSADVTARLLAEHIRPAYAPQVVVENRTGAGGRLALGAVKGAAPDGTTAVLTPSGMLTIYPHVYASLRYDPLRDFAPVSPVCAFPLGLVVPPTHPARTLGEFAEWARRQGQVEYGTAGAGSGQHFLGVQIGQALGITMTHVPYRGTAPALQDLMSGRLPSQVGVLAEMAEYHRAGRLRLLATSAPMRSAAAPDVPTFAELGHPGLTLEEWFGVLLPAGTPEPLVGGLHGAVAAAAAVPAFQATLAERGYTLSVMSAAAFAARIAAERDRWGPVVRQSGFRAED